jgi:hypothetical protein
MKRAEYSTKLKFKHKLKIKIMEKDTVLLNVETYNELRDFKKEIEDGYTYRVYIGMWGSSLRFIGTDEALEEMGQKLEEKQKEINELKKLSKKEPSKKEPSIDEIKSMSWWKFRKWKAGKL